MSLVITGARALVKLSGDVVLFASGVSVTHEQRLEEIPQLDNLEIAEYAENGHRCSVTINSFKLAPDANIGGQQISNSAVDFSMDYHFNNANGTTTLNGGGFNPNSKQPTDGDIKQLLLQAELLIEIVADVNGNESAIYTATGCKFAGGTGELDARGVWNGVWNFRCRRGTGI